LNIFTVLIVLYQNATVVLYITIPVAINTDHRMIRKFITDA
jgi:hypothetical protein